jgi:hypothetical protein
LLSLFARHASPLRISAVGCRPSQINGGFWLSCNATIGQN